MSVSEACLKFMGERYQEPFGYWSQTAKKPINKDDLMSYCDVIYSLYFLNWPIEIQKNQITGFIKMVFELKLYGSKISQTDEFDCNCHLSAYLLGTVQLLRHAFPDVTSEIKMNMEWDFKRILDNNNIPKFPSKFTHHSWRVSHWLGGVPSIILNVYRETQDENYKQLLNSVLNSLEEQAIDDNGLIKVHKSKFLHSIFRTLYKIKHSPKIGDIGGIVHILWVYHFLGKGYKANDNLLDYSVSLVDLNKRFMEGAPYCIDFDFIQLIRTAASKDVDNISKYENIFNHFNVEVTRYLTDEVNACDSFTLHKLPGALATLAETRLALQQIREETFERRFDVIKVAAWL